MRLSRVDEQLRRCIRDVVGIYSMFQLGRSRMKQDANAKSVTIENAAGGSSAGFARLFHCMTRKLRLGFASVTEIEEFTGGEFASFTPHRELG
jgi:hypothetical protein